MNLLVKKFGPLAVILLSALMAISCEDPGKIGLVVNADNGVISTHYLDTILPTSMVQFEPRKTSESSSVQSGQYTNPDFGVVTAITYSQLDLALIIVPEATAQYNSFEVEVSFTSYIGDSPSGNETQEIGIFQLTEEIDSTEEYTRLDNLNFDQGNPLGTWVFSPELNDTTQIDTTFVVALDDAVGQDLFDKFRAEDPIFDNDAAFNAYFKGIAFVPTANNKNIFQIDAGLVTFKLNYYEYNSDGTEIDRTYELHLGNSAFYHIDSDKENTVISGILPNNEEFDPDDGYRYLQYGTLMAIKVDLTPFYKLTDTLSHLIINKAEIYIGNVKQYNDDLQPPAYLQTYFTDSTASLWPIVDDIGRGDTSQVGVHFIMHQDEESFVPPGIYAVPSRTFYDPENFNYRLDMSVFLQNLYSGNFHSDTEPFLEEEAHLYLFGETDVIFPQKTPSHVLTTPMAVHNESIRLRIHYTIPTEQNQ